MVDVGQVFICIYHVRGQQKDVDLVLELICLHIYQETVPGKARVVSIGVGRNTSKVSTVAELGSIINQVQTHNDRLVLLSPPHTGKTKLEHGVLKEINWVWTGTYVVLVMSVKFFKI